MKDALHHGGFFVLRTPLFPFSVLSGLSDGLEAPGAVTAPERLSAALACDRVRVRDRLRTLAFSPVVRDAIAVASPDLERSLDHWLSQPESERGLAVERALTRYISRMAARPTPFGLFAGSGVGRIDRRTDLRTGSLADCRRHTRLDMDYLAQLADSLAREPAIADGLCYFPNSSLYRLADRWRYVETRLVDKVRSHHLVALDHTEALDQTLARAHGGATRARLAAALVDDEITKDEARAYVDELIENQVLVPELECPVTGREPLPCLEATLRRTPAGQRPADELAAIGAELAAIDAAGLGVEPARYRAIARRLEAFPVAVDPSRLFQVDLVRPAPSATLGQDVVDEIVRGVDILRRLTPEPEQDPLRRLREAFEERYEQGEVPLLEMLDAEDGIASALAEDRDPSPLLDTLDFPSPPFRSTPWSHREAGLLRRVGEALANGQQEIRLLPRDIEELATKDPPPLPNAFAAMAALAGVTGDSRHSDFRVLLQTVSGPSGGALLGRFCHADAELLACLTGHLASEEAIDPEALHAEIVHLPEGRLGNILLRPLLRGFEIPYLGRSGAPRDRQIPASDLTVSLADGRFVLRSSRLGRRIVPRLTSAHNFLHRSLGVYRFLCLLQADGLASGCTWTWGALDSLPFLPRVTSGRVVFSRARWRVPKEEAEALTTVRDSRRYAAVQSWRAARRLPRWTVLADYDNTLLVDLENIVSVDAFVPLLKGRESATLTEAFPATDELPATGPDGRYLHEIVVPFTSTRRVATDASGEPVRAHLRTTTRAQRYFPPGSDWIYAKLYGGVGAADRLLRDIVGPVSRELMSSGAIRRWFFIRYADPGPHLRWRLLATPRKAGRVRRAVEAGGGALVEEGRSHRLVVDTYQREIERYGGPEGIDAAEDMFWADSEAVIDLVDMLSGEHGERNARWHLAIVGVHMFVTDLGLDDVSRLKVMRSAREQWGRKLRVDAHLRRQLAKKFRSARADLAALIDGTTGSDGVIGAGRRVFAERSTRVRPIVARLKVLDREGRLTKTLDTLAASYVHMHLNRLFRAEPNLHEVVIYDFLTQLYSQHAARQKHER